MIVPGVRKLTADIAPFGDKFRLHSAKVCVAS